MATVTKTKLIGYAKATGLIGVPLAFVLVYYLLSLSAIEVINHSGDMYCAGTEIDPCIAEITFLAKKSISISNTTWLFSTDKNLKSLELQVNNKQIGKSLSFSKGKKYTLKYIGYKNNPNDTIRWSFGDIK
jgi:hypothetical protein